MHIPLFTPIRQRILRSAGNLRYSTDRDPSSDTSVTGMELIWFKRFEVMFAVIAGLALAFAIMDATQPLAQRLLAAPILGLIVALYLRLIHNRDARNIREGLIYLATAVPLLLVLILLHPAFYLLVFAAYWQVFTFLGIRRAMAVASVLTIMLLSLDSGEGLRLPFTSGSDWLVFGLNIIFGGMMAGFIHSLFVQSERRQHLIEELNATRAQLILQERQAGVLEERHRIAADFHDTVAQDLASVVMQLEAAEAKLPPGMAAVRAHIHLARDTARSGLVEARRIVHALVPDVLTGHSISDALRITSSRWSESTRTPCSFEVIGDPPAIDRTLEVVLLRSLQEALTNVRKHANASLVVITLTNLGDELVLDVHDNGRGFDPESMQVPLPSEAGAVTASGMGLVAMTERVRSIGGSISIESEPGHGATVSISLPIPASGRAEPVLATDGSIRDIAHV